MKWTKREIMHAPNEELVFQETISCDASTFLQANHVKELHDVTVSGKLRYEETENCVYADLDISGVMIVPCSITNEDIEYDFHTKSLEVFAFEGADAVDAHETKGDVVELMPVVFSLILMEVPMKAVKEGATYPKGNGWEVVREEDYQKERKKEIDPRLAKLREFKLEEE